MKQLRLEVSEVVLSRGETKLLMIYKVRQKLGL